MNATEQLAQATSNAQSILAWLESHPEEALAVEHFDTYFGPGITFKDLATLQKLFAGRTVKPISGYVYVDSGGIRFSAPLPKSTPEELTL